MDISWATFTMNRHRAGPQKTDTLIFHDVELKKIVYMELQIAHLIDFAFSDKHFFFLHLKGARKTP